MWGPHNVVEDAAKCCAACRAHGAKEANGKGCNVWVWCSDPNGCAGQKFGECWGKRHAFDDDGHGGVLLPKTRGSGDTVHWESGALVTPAQAKAMRAAEEAVVRARIERRERAGNPRVYFDVVITHSDGSKPSGAEAGGRIEFVLYAHEAPRAAENFRTMCTGEKGGSFTYTGMKFYRIIDMFIDQAGSHSAGAIWGGSFDDDPGGLLLRHERPGLLSAANSGPDTNSGHFSIVVAPAPHLDGGYTIFGEVVSGFDVMMAINKLDKYVKGSATVARAGCLANCEPRPHVAGKCKTREASKRPVQGRPIYPCID